MLDFHIVTVLQALSKPSFSDGLTCLFNALYTVYSVQTPTQPEVPPTAANPVLKRLLSSSGYISRRPIPSPLPWRQVRVFIKTLTSGRSWRWRCNGGARSGCCGRWWRSSAPTPSHRAWPGSGSTWWSPDPSPALGLGQEVSNRKWAHASGMCWHGSILLFFLIDNRLKMCPRHFRYSDINKEVVSLCICQVVML